MNERSRPAAWPLRVVTAVTLGHVAVSLRAASIQEVRWIGQTWRAPSSMSVLDSSPRAPFPDGPLDHTRQLAKIQRSSRQLAIVQHN